MAPDGSRARRMTPDERRAAIVAATTPLVLRHGAGVTTRQIAEAARVAEGTIFRVFPDKDSVLRAVVAEALDPELTLRDLAEIDRGLPFRDRLTAVVRVVQHRVSEVFGLLGALGWPGPQQEREGSAENARRRMPPNREEINDAFDRAVADVIGDDAGRFRVPAGVFAHIMRMFVFSATHPLITGGRPLDAEEIVSVLLDGVLDHSLTGTPLTTTEDHAC